MKVVRAHTYVFCALAAALMSGAPSVIFHALTDARFDWFPRDATGTVTVVAVDTQSIKKVGVWPWPRTLHADLLRKLDEAGASEIVFDIDFSSRQSAGADEAFLAALRDAHGSVVLPSFMQAGRDADGKVTTEVTAPLAEFRKSAWPATANVVSESDGLVRKYPLGMTLDGEFVPSIGALLASTYDRHGGDFFIDFAIGADTVPVLSYVDVLEGRVPVERIKGKKVIVGATAIELGDRFNVPNGQVIAGPKLQALATESLLQGRALARTGIGVTLLGLVGISTFAWLVWRQERTVVRISALAGLAIGAELLATVSQVRWGVLLDTSLWHVAIAGYAGAAAIEEVNFRDLMAKVGESRFRRIAMSLAEGLVCTDSRGIITFCNPSVTQIFGYDQEELVGQSFDTLLVLDEQSKGGADGTIFLPDAEQAADRLLDLKGRRKSGEVFALEASLSSWRHTDTLHHGLVLRDISARKREEECIRFLAEHDVLTGLANRTKANEELARMLEEAGAELQHVAVILLGLDRFKDLNDTLGQDRGDKVICAVADKLRAQFEPEGIVARVSGDEFAVVLRLPGGAVQGAREVVGNVASRLANVSIELGDRVLTVEHSLGSALFPEDGERANELMANAALALQDAKLHHRGGHVAYCSVLRSKIEWARQLEKELSRAFACGEFVLFYQPQVDIRTRRVVGAEALIRWRHPQRGIVPPGEFLPVLDTMPLSEDVGRWVIATACRQAGEWHRAGHDIRVSMNLAPPLFEGQNLPDVVSSAIREANVPASLIELEVTENILLEDNDRTASMLREIRGTGVSIAFDDFGTGYASLSHLKRFPLDRLKIDRSFVRHIIHDHDDRSIVTALVGLGKLLGMQVVAEGIETLATAEALLQIGCVEGQGYYFGRPVPADEFCQQHLAQSGAPSGPRPVPGAVANELGPAA